MNIKTFTLLISVQPVELLKSAMVIYLCAFFLPLMADKPNYIADMIAQKKAEGAKFAPQTLFTPNIYAPLIAQSLAPIVSEVVVLSADFNQMEQLVRQNIPHISLSVPLTPTRTVLVELTQVTVLTDDFVLSTKGERGEARIKEYCPGRYYRGIVKGDPHSWAAISIFDNEVIGIIATDEGNYVIGRLEQQWKDYVVYNDHNMRVKNPFRCATADTPLPASYFDRLSAEPPASLFDAQAVPTTCGNLVEYYFHADYALYQNKGSNTTTVLNYVSGFFNAVAALYQNEAINVQISETFVWTTDDNFSADAGTALDEFGTYVGNAFNGDLAHLLALPAGNSYSGIAWLDVLCSNSRYAYSQIAASYQSLPTFSWTVEVVTHESGHNLGSPHTHNCSWPGGAIDNCVTLEGGPCTSGGIPANGGTIMSYCHINYSINFNNGFGPLPGNLVRSEVYAASCLGGGFTSSATAAGNTTFCSGGSVVLNASPTGTGYTYQWQSAPVSSPVYTNISGAVTAAYTATASNKYRVIVTDANGCPAYSLNVPVTVAGGGTPDAVFTYSGSNMTVNFGNTSTNSTTYSWNFGEPASGSSNASTDINPSHTYLTTGVYTVTLTATNTCATPAVSDTYTAIIDLSTPLPCSGLSDLVGCSGTITDGSGSQDYSNNQSCQWRITGTAGQAIQITFSAFATEAGYDYVRIYDGNDATATLLGSYSGATLPSTITTTANVAYITFSSDELVTGAGFMLNYTCVTPPPPVVLCSGTTLLTDCNGTISDGSSTSNYDNNMACNWSISPPGATSITLTFSNFNTEANYDFVKIWDSPDNSGTVLGNFSGTALPASVTANSGSMLVRFTSDPSVVAAGWTATYSCVIPSTPTTTLQARAYLEGAYSGTTLLTTLAANGLVPLTQPFNQSPWNYTGTETVASLPNGTCDWVLIELRDIADPTQITAQKAAFIRNDGTLMDTDGNTTITINANSGSYYVVIKHRNHAPVMSAAAITLPAGASYDFTQQNNIYGGSSQASQVANGIYALSAGEITGNAIITYQDANAIIGQFTGAMGYHKGDCNFDGIVNNADFDKMAGNIRLIGHEAVRY